MDNPEIIVKDERIKQIDAIVTEVKQSEEWEAVRMNILQIGEAHGRKIGEEIGKEIGKKNGEEIGRDMMLVEQVCCKLHKGKTAAQIAEDLEAELKVIDAICRAAESAAPQYDSDVVYRNWKRSSE